MSRVFGWIAFPIAAVALFAYYMLFGVRSFEARRNRVASRSDAMLLIREAYSFGGDDSSMEFVNGAGASLSSFRKEIAGVDDVRIWWSPPVALAEDRSAWDRTRLAVGLSESAAQSRRPDGGIEICLGDRVDLVDQILEYLVSRGMIEFEKGIDLLTRGVTVTARLGWLR